MSLFLKTVVLYLSMLAIPVQGYAASAMLHCGFAHQHAPAAQDTAHSSAHGHAHPLAVDHRHQGEAALSPDSIAYASIGGELAFTVGDRGLAKDGEARAHEGNEHAACPAGAAVSASSLGFQPAESAIERIAPKHLLNIAFVTDAPKRPPRSFLA